ITDSPAPSTKRTPINSSTACSIVVGSIAVSAVVAPHNSTPTVNTRRGPKRADNHPAGNWNTAYPIKNELKIHPSRWFPNPYSRLIGEPAAGVDLQFVFDRVCGI